MHFSVTLFCIVTLVSAWTGSDTFAPKRSAEVIFLGDATTTADQITTALSPLKADIGDLFDAYKSAGLSFKVGYHITGGQDGKCWRPKLDLTDDVSAVKNALEGKVMDSAEITKIAAFWNMVASVALGQIFSKDAAIRRVIVVISEKTPYLREEEDMDLVLWQCDRSAVSYGKYHQHMERSDTGFLYSAEHYHVATTEEAAAQISKLLAGTSTTDYKVVSQSSYPESGPSGRSIIPALAEMLSEPWIESRSVQIWPGVKRFAPKQSAEVLFVTDATSGCILSYVVMPLRASMVAFFDAYKKAGLTVKVGLHIAGGRGGKCFRPKLDLTADVAAIKDVLYGSFVDLEESTMEPDFWNTILYLAESGKFTEDNKVRKVVVVLSVKTPKWGSEVTQPDMSSIECGHPSPTTEQFKKVVEKHRISVVYSAEHVYEDTTVEVAGDVTALLSSTGLTDWLVVDQSTYGTGGYSGRSVMPSLARVLSSEWIASTSTPSPA